MSFNVETLKQVIADHGPVVRVVVAGIAGSTPREVGTSMLVWADGQEGTIGGGALEFEAAQAARRLLASGRANSVERIALGPARGQCCGGAVTLVSECFDQARLSQISGPVFARPIDGSAEAPLSVRRRLARLRNGSEMQASEFLDGWMIEPLCAPKRPLWIWGAGHVGRALVSTMAPLPDFKITWVDTDLDRFPKDGPKDISILPAANPADAVPLAPADAMHLIVTYSHALDLELCHRLMTHGFGFAGVIGSATKWARFRKRLGELGHSSAQISRICCPIGQPELGKHPQAIAVGVTAALLQRVKERQIGDVPVERIAET